MDSVKDFQEVRDAFQYVKSSKQRFLTNFYPDPSKVERWIDCNDFFKEIIGNTIFFLRKKPEFYCLYFYSSSLDDLERALAILKSMENNNLFVVDIVGKKNEIELILDAFLINGFYKYTTLNRMSKNSVDNIYDTCNNVNLKNAHAAHSHSLSKLLFQYFDPKAEQVPTDQEINEWIELGQVIVFEENREILGFMIYDLIGITSYLKYWFVHPNHRNKKIGSIMLNEFFKKSSGTKRQLFWVIETNKNAIKRYLHYGFKPENLFDYILINKNERYEAKSS